MKNKGKKLYFTIMGLVLAVTMAITSTITLAFFGASGGGTATIKLANGVDVESSMTITSAPRYLVPSENFNFEAIAKVKPIGNGEMTKGLLRAKLSTHFEDGQAANNYVSIVAVSSTTAEGKTLYWNYYNGYYYLMTTNSTSGVLAEITPSTAGTECPLIVSVMVSDSLGNSAGGNKFSVSVTFSVIQAKLYNSTGTTLLTNTIENTEDVFYSVEGKTTQASSLKRIEGNSIQNGTPSPSNPVGIQSVGDMTSNLFIFDNIDNTGSTLNMVNYTDKTLFLKQSEQMSIIGDSFTSSPQAYNNFNSVFNLLEPGYYCLSAKISANTTNIEQRSNWVINHTEGTISPVSSSFIDGKIFFKYNITAEQLNQMKNAITCRLYFYHFRDKTSKVNVDATVSEIMFIKGDYTFNSMPEYEPYGKYKIPVNVNGTTYNIFLDEPLRKVGDVADYIDFETGQLVRQVYHEKITNVEYVSGDGGPYVKFLTDLTQIPLINGSGVSSNAYAISNKFNKSDVMYSVLHNYSNLIQPYKTTGGVYRIAYTFDDTTITTIEQAQAKIGNGFDVFYVLANPIITNIGLSHIPTSSSAIYGVFTEVQPNIVFGE